MLELSLKLLLAHIIGDFVCQPNAWVKDKKNRKIKSKYLYFHLLTHGIALAVCLLPLKQYWAGLLIVLGTHYIIDLTKLYLSDRADSRIAFLVDQLAHLFVIALVVRYYEPFEIDLGMLASPQALLLVVSLLVCTSVIGVVMKQFLARWQNEIESQESESRQESMSLNNAGIYIGMLERLFVFFFVVAGQFGGIGFLLAAKSVFRFGDLRHAKDRKLTEYILIGTLLSFGFAIAIAKAYLWLSEFIGDVG